MVGVLTKKQSIQFNGKIVMYNYTSLFDTLPDGTLACKYANKFMLRK